MFYHSSFKKIFIIKTILSAIRHPAAASLSQPSISPRRRRKPVRPLGCWRLYGPPAYGFGAGSCVRRPSQRSLHRRPHVRLTAEEPHEACPQDPLAVWRRHRGTMTPSCNKRVLEEGGARSTPSGLRSGPRCCGGGGWFGKQQVASLGLQRCLGQRCQGLGGFSYFLVRWCCQPPCCTSCFGAGCGRKLCLAQAKVDVL